MFGFSGFTFMSDKNAYTISPTNMTPITSIQLQNGIYDNINLTRDVTSPYSSDDKVWDFFTVLDSNFNGNINGGNVDIILSQISSIRIKRRIVGAFEWIKIAEFPVNKESDLIFSLDDFLNADGVEYEYALVPTLNNIEGTYIINSILSKLNGVFICDTDSIYKFYSGVSYGTAQQVQKTGILEPLGSKYPITIINAKTNYQQGSLTGTILPPNFEKDRKLDRNAMVKTKKLLNEFFTNKKAKIIKDWNSNIFLVMLINGVGNSYVTESSMGIVDVNVEWVEQGDANNQQDLYINGFVKEVN